MIQYPQEATSGNDRRERIPHYSGSGSTPKCARGNYPSLYSSEGAACTQATGHLSYPTGGLREVLEESTNRIKGREPRLLAQSQPPRSRACWHRLAPSTHAEVSSEGLT